MRAYAAMIASAAMNAHVDPVHRVTAEAKREKMLSRGIEPSYWMTASALYVPASELG